MVPTPTPDHSQEQRTRHRRRAHQLTTLITLSALLLPTLANSVSLSEFQPSIDPTTLTPSCSAIYTSTLPSCTALDFSGRCSSGCINALVALYSPVFDACGSNATNDQLLVGNFLAGNAIGILCRGVVVVTMSQSSVTTAATLPTRIASSQLASSRVVSSEAVSSQIASATQYQSTAPIAFPAYGSSIMPLHSSSTSVARSHSRSTVTTEVTSTIYSKPTEQTVHPYTSNTSLMSVLLTSITTGNAPTGTQTTAAQYSHCVEYESNPFKNCGDDQGSGAVALRTSLWRVGGLILVGVLGRVVIRDVL